VAASCPLLVRSSRRVCRWVVTVPRAGQERRQQGRQKRPSPTEVRLLHHTWSSVTYRQACAAGAVSPSLPFCSRLVPSGARAAFCCGCTWNIFGVVLRRGWAGPVGAHGVSLVRCSTGSVRGPASWSCAAVQLRGAHGTSMHAITVPRLRQTRQRQDARAGSMGGEEGPTGTIHLQVRVLCRAGIVYA
jgi:hypothetical protein